MGLKSLIAVAQGKNAESVSFEDKLGGSEDGE